jgi:hypothetical protein
METRIAFAYFRISPRVLIDRAEACVRFRYAMNHVNLMTSPSTAKQAASVQQAPRSKVIWCKVSTPLIMSGWASAWKRKAAKTAVTRPVPS